MPIAQGLSQNFVCSRLKRWNFLSNGVPYTQLPFIGDYVKIAAAFTNSYRHHFVSDKPQDEKLAKQMLLMISKPNNVMEKVSYTKIKKKEKWIKLDAEALDVKISFPVLSEQYLRGNLAYIS